MSSEINKHDQLTVINARVPNIHSEVNTALERRKERRQSAKYGTRQG